MGRFHYGRLYVYSGFVYRFVDDMARAKKFYIGIFGWEIIETGGSDYSLATTVGVDECGVSKERGAIKGALYLRESPGESPLIVINVPSIDEYLEKVERAGGRVV